MEQTAHPVHEQNPVIPPRRAGIVGLGLIGGSLARALHLRAGLEIVGLDTDEKSLRSALNDGILAAGGLLAAKAQASEHGDEPAGNQAERILYADPERHARKESGDPWTLLAACAIVFICTPAATVPDLVARAADVCPGLITDVSSVKQPILSQISCSRFVGGHPMAGSERQGYAWSSDTLLENAVYVICVPPGSSLSYQDIHWFEEMIRMCGATPLHMDASDHDRAVAAVSHLPHVAAAALSLLAARADEGSLSRLAAGGFRDITRIASSDPSLWAGISLQSRAMLLPLVKSYAALLEEFSEALEAGDGTALYRLFFQAAQYRNALPVDGRGALTAHSSLTVYVKDRPGELGRITTLLGQNDINISNIRIRELRTYEGGCLQLLLPDSGQAVRAAWLLKEAGYECD